MDKHRREPPAAARSPLTIKLLGVEWPLPTWALAPGALILLLALSAYVAQQVGLPLLDRLRDRSVDEAEAREAYKHTSLQEQSVSLYTDHRSLSVNLYPSDGCLQVVRNARARWLISAAAALGGEAAPGRISELPAVSAGALPWESEAEAQPAPAGVPSAHGCRNPHPGSFKQWEGERRGCWRQEFREWTDGCRHYQWFDACHRAWDVNPDGSPRVYWTVCKH